MAMGAGNCVHSCMGDRGGLRWITADGRCMS